MNNPETQTIIIILHSNNVSLPFTYKSVTYTIHINDKSKKAKSIINMLKTLGEDYDFIDIVKESDDIYPATKQILQKRHIDFLENPEGKDWKVLKEELKKL